MKALNSLTPGRFGCDYEYAIFNLALLSDIFRSSYDNALRLMSKDLTGNKSTLVEVMAWCRQATSHYLSQCWPRSLSPYGVTRPQWVNLSIECVNDHMTGLEKLCFIEVIFSSSVLIGSNCLQAKILTIKQLLIVLIQMIYWALSQDELNNFWVRPIVVKPTLRSLLLTLQAWISNHITPLRWSK